MSVIHSAGTLPVATLVLAVTVASMTAVDMVAILMDPTQEEVRRQGLFWTES